MKKQISAKFITISYNGKVKFEKPFFQTRTHLVGEINVSYDELVKTFGLPNEEGDDYKTDAEWSIFTPDGVATIYNYKDGKNYLGKEGLNVKDIRDWHIGGQSKSVISWIEKVLGIKND